MNMEVINRLHTYYSTCRYQGIALTSNDLRSQDALAHAIHSYYPTFDYWRQPGVDTAPPLECYVTEFCERALHPVRQGLLIVDPEQWLHRWNLPNQGTFWSRLSGHYGGVPVIVFAKDVLSTTKLVEPYFKPRPLADCEARLWISKYQGA